MRRKSISSIKSTFIRRFLLLICFVPIIILTYLIAILEIILEVSKEIPSTFKEAWKGN